MSAASAVQERPGAAVASQGLTDPLVAFLAAALDVKASAAPTTYVGPPPVPCVQVRAVGTEHHDPAGGRLSGAWQVAAYGLPLDLTGAVDAADHTRSDLATTHGVGTIRTLRCGTVERTTMPDGTVVESATVDVTGYPWLPCVALGEELDYSVRAAAGHVAAGISSRLVQHVGLSRVAHGWADVEGATSDGETVTATIVVAGERDAALSGLDLAGVARSAAAEAVGVLVEYLGRVLSVEVGAIAAEQGPRATAYLIPVTLTLGRVAPEQLK